MGEEEVVELCHKKYSHMYSCLQVENTLCVQKVSITILNTVMYNICNAIFVWLCMMHICGVEATGSGWIQAEDSEARSKDTSYGARMDCLPRHQGLVPPG